MILGNSFIVLLFVFNFCDGRSNVFDEDLYREVLDPELCEEQLEFLVTNGTNVMLQFYDSSVRVPRGFLLGNLLDFGNYHQCLGISFPMQNSNIEGKYCSIEIPIQQNAFPEIPSWPMEVHKSIDIDEETLIRLQNYQTMKEQSQIFTTSQGVTSRVNPDTPLDNLALTVGICIPKVCTTKQVIDLLTLNQSLVNIDYTEKFCRLPNDKPFAPVDYVAITVFSVIGFLMIISTAYDTYHTFIIKKGPGKTIYRSFSIYTNTKKFTTFTSSSTALNCIDGIRSIATLWIILGHSFSTTVPVIANPVSVFEWFVSFQSVWLISAPITVDTFFTLTGLLAVYTSAEKYNRITFLKRFHMYYILRYLRLFPILAATILLQASLMHHLSDGPIWHTVATEVQNCRDHWWTLLLYVQTYVKPSRPCLGLTWYLCVDMQLYWISPLVLIWALGSRRLDAWVALIAGLLAAIVSATTYSFIYDFPSSSINIQPFERMVEYMQKYYINTLCRASPFFVGMLYGYLLHICKGKNINIAPAFVFLYWIIAIAVSSTIIFICYPINQVDYDNQLLDNFLNSFMRPLWGATIGWCIFACAHGYGGPVNWILSLNIWKLPAKLSYAMYVLHYPLMYFVQGSLISPIYFTVAGIVYRFFSDLVLTIIVAFILTLAVEYPFSTIQNLLIPDGRGQKPRIPIKESPQNIPSSDL